MYIALVFILAGLIILVLYSLTSTYIRLNNTYRLAHGAPHHDGYYRLGDTSKPRFRLLIVGDSIGAGWNVPDFKDAVGTRLAEKLAEKYRVIYVNRAYLGNWISDIANNNIEGEWDLIAQLTASNDVLHGIDKDKFEKDCLRLAENMKKHSKKVLIAGPGDAATVPLFPWWLRRVFRKREQVVSNAFKKAANSIDAAYVNTLKEPRLTQNIGSDNMHLSAKGDEVLFECIWREIERQGWFQ
jgi:lysophospholipase L1-like esterase